MLPHPRKGRSEIRRFGVAGTIHRDLRCRHKIRTTRPDGVDPREEEHLSESRVQRYGSSSRLGTVSGCPRDELTIWRKSTRHRRAPWRRRPSPCPYGINPPDSAPFSVRALNAWTEILEGAQSLPVDPWFVRPGVDRPDARGRRRTRTRPPSGAATGIRPGPTAYASSVRGIAPQAWSLRRAA